ncbi:hypothetical protein RhiirA4_524757 [Rhizophagus irregularis]|uniref:Uncharacterized protein n=1 Tax=Rhizophagus irregularis TaxID=588596 RepID=A0A2I1HSZ0_9GLOM|nr:hypothetical protein RhiirA4_524757 [Rhizophagus irregularis]
MEEAVEDSCTNGDIRKVWLIRNKKTIYKEEKKGSRIATKESRKEESVLSNKMNVESEPKEISNEPSTPMTPPDRIYRELGNFKSRQESSLHPSKEQALSQRTEKPSNDDSDSDLDVYTPLEAEERSKSMKKTPEEQKIVDMIKRWRLNEELTPDQTDNQKYPPVRKELKKDNVAPEEVVKIINEHRDLEKIKYVQYNPLSASHEEAKDKLDEIHSIFKRLENEMEWEKINTQAISEVTETLSPKELRWMKDGSDTINFTIG